MLKSPKNPTFFVGLGNELDGTYQLVRTLGKEQQTFTLKGEPSYEVKNKIDIKRITKLKSYKYVII